MKKYTIKQLLQYENIISVSFSFDNKNLLFSSNKDGAYNAYMVSIKKEVPKQLTFSKTSPIIAISFMPNSTGFLYESDRFGNELSHIYYKSLVDEKVVDLTPGQNEKAKFLSWSCDMESFFYLSNKRDKRFMDLYEMDTESFNSNLIFKNNQGYNICSVSPDKKKVSLHKNSTGGSEIFLLSTSTNKSRTLLRSLDANTYPTIFDFKSEFLYLLTNEKSEYYGIKKINLSDLSEVNVSSENGDVKFIGVSPRYKYFFYGINENSSIKFKIFNYFEGKELQINNLPDGQITNMSVSYNEEYISIVINSSTTPSTLYIYNIADEKLNKIYSPLFPEVKGEDLVSPKLINYRATDGNFIPAIFYEPKNKNGKVPAMIFAHGGPGGQSTISYNPLIQYIVNNGIAVLDVNYRGSSGYGKKYYDAADLKHGNVDLQDCIDGKRYLISTGKIKEDSIGIIGSSYGGYLVLAALAFKPNEFRLGINLYGVSNWERTLMSIPPWWESKRKFLYNKLGNPYTQKEYIRSISPLFYAENIIQPLMVVQGANDPRVLKIESDEIVNKVAENNIYVKYLLFKDEGHGLTIEKNRITAYEEIVCFLKIKLY